MRWKAMPRHRRLVVVAALATVPVLIVPITATADAPQQQGWWASSNPGGLPIEGAPPITDVPEDGLLVQAGPSGPTAYAALTYQVGEATPGQLVLKVAPSTVTSPGATLALCALADASFEPAQGGPMADAPKYDCQQTTEAAVDAASSSFTFDVASLVDEGTLAVAILPTGAARVVLAKPDEQSLETTSGTSSGPVGTSGGTGTTTAPPLGGAPAEQPAAGVDSGFVTAPGISDQPPADAAAPDALIAEQEPVAAPAEAPAAPLDAAPVAATGDAGGGARPVLTLVLAAMVLGALLWAFAGGSAAAAPAAAGQP